MIEIKGKRKFGMYNGFSFKGKYLIASISNKREVFINLTGKNINFVKDNGEFLIFTESGKIINFSERDELLRTGMFSRMKFFYIVSEHVFKELSLLSNYERKSYKRNFISVDKSSKIEIKGLILYSRFINLDDLIS